ncbi:MAG: rRNA maturation RNase YbeY [Candidatus Yanofskybacteria bacterium RIFCSPHIGHO2_02_FULL_39_10]|uniref:Endoribonuclease YbeY n=1 Tax=Candidatus Yanofskybacteria bacterium RIFCSPHIGHO2_02_FULL_39_10 TaxID=1802674 RepID=A0A1F8F6K3_9BACT|nr:MAG: rRNA maturation RNase YbeY [Candidatus Yanofskybacteria bacterium RIFCSPHIGHO2_02_FULL_39_10]
MLDLTFQNFTSDKSLKGDFFKKILIAGAGELGLKDRGIEISLNLVGESKIRELNKKYRHKDKATDVLSFPMFGKSEIRNSKFVIHDLGDIFICLPFAKNDAKSENVSIEKKLSQLAAHGFLHLLGYDHEKSQAEARRMFGLESQILKKLKFK